MGKGAGNCCSSSETAPASPPAAIAVEPVKPAPKPVAVAAAPVVMVTKVAIIYYSTYGHIRQMAEKMKEGVDAVEGVEATIYQVPDILPAEVLEKMHAPPKADHPIIKAADLTNFDGFLFGFPTRFGMMAASMKAFFDTTGGLWQSGGLVGKPAGLFTSSGTQGGGIETTALTAVTQLTHHGMIFVPTGYAFGSALFSNDEVRGGTAYGASTLAGADGSRQPSKLELDFAEFQGKYFAGVAAKLAK